MVTTKGIVFQQIDYSDTSVIARIYTEEFGLKAYMVRGAKGKKTRGKRAMLQPLSLVEVTARHREDGKMCTLKDIRLVHPFSSLPFDVIKRTIGLFLAEVLCKTIREEGQQKDLFSFLWHAVQLLDVTEETRNFHVGFMLHLTRYLGFFPAESDLDNPNYFDLREGCFTVNIPTHPDYIEGAETKAILDILGTKFDGISTVRLNNRIRRVMLQHVLQYYKLHLDGMQEVNSHRILEAVLND